MVCPRPRNRVTVVFGSLLALAATMSCALADEVPTTPVAPANAPGRSVGNLGDTRTLQFEGLQLFTAAQLRGKLECDLRYQAAARPSGDLEPLPADARRTTRGRLSPLRLPGGEGAGELR